MLREGLSRRHAVGGRAIRVRAASGKALVGIRRSWRGILRWQRKRSIARAGTCANQSRKSLYAPCISANSRYRPRSRRDRHRHRTVCEGNKTLAKFTRFPVFAVCKSLVGNRERGSRMIVDRRVFIAGAAITAFSPAHRLLASDVVVPELKAVLPPVFMISGWSTEADSSPGDEIWMRVGHGWRTAWR